MRALCEMPSATIWHGVLTVTRGDIVLQKRMAGRATAVRAGARAFEAAHSAARASMPRRSEEKAAARHSALRLPTVRAMRHARAKVVFCRSARHDDDDAITRCVLQRSAGG